MHFTDEETEDLKGGSVTWPRSQSLLVAELRQEPRSLGSLSRPVSTTLQTLSLPLSLQGLAQSTPFKEKV